MLKGQNNKNVDHFEIKEKLQHLNPFKIYALVIMGDAF